MPRTSLLSAFARLAEEHAGAEHLGVSPAEFRNRRHEVLTRRRFLQQAGTVGAGLAAAATFGSRVAGEAAPEPKAATERVPVAIVGGGIAGLATALRLADKHVTATVFEVSDRVGGRMHSNTTNWADGQVSEWAGELIDTGHKTMRSLPQRFRLNLVGLPKAEPAETTETLYFDGGFYPTADADQNFAAVYRAAVADLRAAGYPTTWQQSTAVGRALDAMTLYDWTRSASREDTPPAWGN